MKPVKITVHTLVKNEQRWIWFALMSVIDYVDEILVWDTGSTDKTAAIVRSIDNRKIKFKQLNNVDAQGHSDSRQKMLDETVADWIFILDGDEVWWQDSIKTLTSVMRNSSNIAAIISPFYNAVGDVFHYQDPKLNLYKIKQYQGAYNIRAINRKQPDLTLNNPHGRQEYRTKDMALQNLPNDKLLFVDAPYLHLTHLPRSMSHADEQATLKRAFKFRYELGLKFTLPYPEVFYWPLPASVPNPFFKRSLNYTLIAIFLTPLRFVKNKLTSKNNLGY